jgi:hypothetical protein
MHYRSGRNKSGIESEFGRPWQVQNRKDEHFCVTFLNKAQKKA